MNGPTTDKMEDKVKLKPGNGRVGNELLETQLTPATV